MIQLLAWSAECKKKKKKAIFLQRANVLFGQRKGSQTTFVEDDRNQRIFTAEKLKCQGFGGLFQ